MSNVIDALPVAPPVGAVETTPVTLSPVTLPPVTLHVCLTCRKADEPAEADIPRSGRRLHDALAAALGKPGPIRVVGVECLSNCKRACTIAVSGEGRWTYVYGDLDPDQSVPAILDGATRYQATADGLVPWRERPEIFKRGVIARVPAFPVSETK